MPENLSDAAATVDADVLAELRTLQRELAVRQQDLAARIDALTAAPRTGSEVPSSTGQRPEPATSPPSALGRRGLLRAGVAAAGAVAAGGVGAALLAPGTAAAATGDGLVLGSANDADAATTLVPGSTAAHGFGVVAGTPSAGALGSRKPGLFAYSDGSAASPPLMAINEAAGHAARFSSHSDAIRVEAGVGHPNPPGVSGGAIGVDISSTGQGISISSADVGVLAVSSGAQGIVAQGTRGVVGLGSSNRTDLGAVEGVASFGIGVVGSGKAGGGALRGGSYDLALGGYGPTPRAAPTGDSQAHAVGELVEDATGVLWLCTAAGTPGSWRKVGGPTTAGAFHVLPTPVRAYDSRPLTKPAIGPKTPLGNGIERTIDLKLNATGVPAGATAALVTVLLVNAAAGNGNFTLWAGGVARPQANTLVWGGATGRFSTQAITALDDQARCQVNASTTTDVVLDVVGYYR